MNKIQLALSALLVAMLASQPVDAYTQVRTRTTIVTRTIKPVHRRVIHIIKRRHVAPVITVIRRVKRHIVKPRIYMERPSIGFSFGFSL
jgi:hypothetical protein